MTDTLRRGRRVRGASLSSVICQRGMWCPGEVIPLSALGHHAPPQRGAEMRKLHNRFDHFLARHMGRRLAYWVGITVGAYATTGKYGNTIVPELTMTDALKRWHDDHQLGG